jgi:hypothetical protein
MGLSVWFQEDVKHILRAAHVAGRKAQMCSTLAYRQAGGGDDLDESPDGGCLPSNEDRFCREDGQAPPQREIAAFWHGYEAALATVSTAFGLALFDEDLAFLKRLALPSGANGHRRRWNLDVRGEQP